MTTIRTTCPRCGAVEMGAEAILLSVRDQGREGFYRFLCPGCLDTVQKPADRKIVALLLSVGVDVESDGEDLEDLDEAGAGAATGAAAGAARGAAGEPHPEGRRPGGRTFTMDDVIAFHFLLEDDERLARELQAFDT
jgi:hypothetical protein